MGINLQHSRSPIGRTEHVPQEEGQSRPIRAKRCYGKNTPPISEGAGGKGGDTSKVSPSGGQTTSSPPLRRSYIPLEAVRKGTR